MPSVESEDFPRLGRYQVINRIASGGMAEVFLAKAVGAMGFQRLVALKLIHANFTRDPEFVKMFIDEARIAMHLHHRNIVQVFDLDRVKDTYFIAMEYVHGVNLYDLYERIAAKNRWIEPPMSLYLVAEVCKGLHFAHTRTGPDSKPLGIVHRDVSPQNVLLSFEGEIKITDFGIATAAERLHQTAAGIVKGKYAYMAPERLQEKPVDGRVDVFSVGVLLYELLVGENPFAGPSAVETIENVLNKKVPPPSERGAPVARRLDDICMRALAKNPADRYPSCQALADAVTEYAMELTFARKDMAAGDAAVTALLQELFSDRARPGAAADPRSFALPGVDLESEARDTSPNGENGAGAHEFLETQDDLGPAAQSGDNDEYDAPTILKMSPAFTGALEPKLVDPSEEPRTARTQGSIRGGTSGFTTLPPSGPNRAAGRGRQALEESSDEHNLLSVETEHESIDATAPTELPPLYEAADPTMRARVADPHHGVRVSKRDDDDDDEAFAMTMPSQNSLDTIEPEPPKVVSIPPVQPARPSTSASPVAQYAPSPPSMFSGPPPSASPSHGAPVYQGYQSVPGFPASHGYSGESHDPLVVPVGGDGSHSQVQTAARGSRINVVAGLLLALAVLAVLAAVVVVQRGEGKPVEVPLAIKTTPAGAMVRVNGREHEELTPTTVRVVANQPQIVQISLLGYESVTKDLSPSEDAILAISETLRPITGSLTVRPQPSEAAVKVGGQSRGTGTVTVAGLPVGDEIEVVVELDGYEPYREQIKLTMESPTQTLSVPLAKADGRSPKRPPPPPPPAAPASRRKVMLTAPYGSWALVYHDGKYLGTTPVEATLPLGEIKLRVRNEESNIDKTITVEVPSSGQEVRLRF